MMLDDGLHFLRVFRREALDKFIDEELVEFDHLLQTLKTPP
jgi:hypothetical protein